MELLEQHHFSGGYNGLQCYLVVTYSLSSLARTIMILHFSLLKGNLKKKKKISYVGSVVGFTYVTGPYAGQNKNSFS